MSTISTAGSLAAPPAIPPTRAYRVRGVAVVAAGLALTGSGAAVVHHFDKTDGTWANEVTVELVAGVLGYLVAYGLGWWRPRRSAARAAAERTALVLALVGALLVPICYWNPMPLTFAGSALMLLHWGRQPSLSPSGSRSAGRSLGRSVSVLSVLVIAVQVVAFVGHVVQLSAK